MSCVLFWKLFSLLLLFSISIHQDHVVNHFSANDTPPSKKISFLTIELLKNHFAIAAMTFHDDLLIEEMSHFLLNAFDR